MSRTRLLTALVAVGLTLAGCAPAAAPSDPPASQGGGSSEPVTPTPSAAAPGDEVPVADLLARLAEANKSVRSYASTSEITVISRGKKLDSVEMTAVVDQSDPDRIRYRDTTPDDKGFGLVLIGDDVRVKFVGRKVWVRPTKDQLTWIRKETTAMQPARALAKAATHLRKAVYEGPADIAGTPVEGYRLTFAGKAYDILQPEDQRVLVGDEIEVRVWLDASGRLLRLSLAVEARPLASVPDPLPTTFTVTLSHLDEPVTITMPKK